LSYAGDVLKHVKLVRLNVANIKMNIAKNVQRLAKNVRSNVKRCNPVYFFLITNYKKNKIFTMILSRNRTKGQPVFTARWFFLLFVPIAIPGL